MMTMKKAYGLRRKNKKYSEWEDREKGHRKGVEGRRQNVGGKIKTKLGWNRE